MATKHDPSKDVTYWLDEIKASRKRHERYRKLGREVFKIYEADRDEDNATPFNILFSNTETLRPALFSAQPRPVVDRRFKDDDATAKLVAQAVKRGLEFHLDTNREGYETVTEAVGTCVLDAILPGRGMVQVKYDADFKEMGSSSSPQQDTEVETDGDESSEEAVEYAEKEQVCVESVVWDRVHLGYAKKWHKVPWIAYEYFLTKEEVTKLAGKATAAKLTYHVADDNRDDEEGLRKTRMSDEEETGSQKTARVYQIWDKAGGRKVRYISDSYKEGYLLVQDDPLGLTGFFNTPRPLMFVEKTCTLTPTAPYAMYRKQAKELNRITRRIEYLIESIKMRGLYDAGLGEQMKTLLSKDDNAYVPADTVAALAAEKGFQNAIWTLPIEVNMQVLQQLYQAREACKQTIYEITGISDILRGATQASETATAQTIKNQWGTLRLKRMQAEVARYVRDLLRLVAEIAADKFSEDTWAEMTGLPFVTTTQRQQLEMQARVMTQMQPPGQPPNPQMAALQQELAKPVWGQILQLMKNDTLRSYRIDIETNSTVEPEAAEDQKAIMEMMGAIGQVMNSLTPLVTSGALDFRAAQSLLLFIARRFRYGSEIEEYIQAMQPPKPQDDGGAEKMKQAQQQLQADKQMAMKELDHKQKQSAMTLKEQGMQQEMQQKQREMDLQLREMQLQMKEHQFGMQQNVEKGLFDLQKSQVGNELDTRKQLQTMQEKKYNVEAVVNKKADTTMGRVEQAMQRVNELNKALQTIQGQAAETQQLLSHLTKLASAKRIKKPIRGKDGRIERVEEEIEAVV